MRSSRNPWGGTAVALALSLSVTAAAALAQEVGFERLELLGRSGPAPAPLLGDDAGRPDPELLRKLELPRGVELRQWRLSEQGELFVLRAEVALTAEARAADVLDWAARKTWTDQVPEGLRAQVARAVVLVGEGTPLRVAAEVQLREDAQPRVARCHVVLGDLTPGAAPAEGRHRLEVSEAVLQTLFRTGVARRFTGSRQVVPYGRTLPGGANQCWFDVGDLYPVLHEDTGGATVALMAKGVQGFADVTGRGRGVSLSCPTAGGLFRLTVAPGGRSVVRVGGRLTGAAAVEAGTVVEGLVTRLLADVGSALFPFLAGQLQATLAKDLSGVLDVLGPVRLVGQSVEAASTTLLASCSLAPVDVDLRKTVIRLLGTTPLPLDLAAITTRDDRLVLDLVEVGPGSAD